MVYAAIADVQGINARRATYSTTTKPTLDQVTTFLAGIDAEINSVLLSKGVSVPVTTPAEFLAYLKRLNALGAASQAEQSMFPERKGGDEGDSSARRLWRMYQDGLKMLRDGSAIPDSVGRGEGVKAETVFTDDADATPQDAQAEVDMVF